MGRHLHRGETTDGLQRPFGPPLPSLTTSWGSFRYISSAPPPPPPVQNDRTPQSVSPNPQCSFGWLPPESPPRSSPSDLCNLQEDLQGSRGPRAQRATRKRLGRSQSLRRARIRVAPRVQSGPGALFLGRKREGGDQREAGWSSGAQRCQRSAAVWAPGFKL